MKRLIALYMIYVVSLPVVSDATTFMDEDFENLANANDQGPSPPHFPFVCPNFNPCTSTDIAHSGTHALKGIYTGFDSGGFWDWSAFGSADDAWVRFWYRTSAFTYGSPDGAAGTKHFNLGDGVNFPNCWLMHEFGANREFGFECQDTLDCGTGSQQYVGCSQFSGNINSIPILDNRWYCVEVHQFMGTPGLSDGKFEVWVDSVQAISRTFGMRGPNLFNPPGCVPGPNVFCNSNQATTSLLRLFVQHGTGSMYYDQLAIGNSRIGCGTVVTAPGTPANLIVN